jgi:hypothetical protein
MERKLTFDEKKKVFDYRLDKKILNKLDWKHNDTIEQYRDSDHEIMLFNITKLTRTAEKSKQNMTGDVLKEFLKILIENQQTRLERHQKWLAYTKEKHMGEGKSHRNTLLTTQYNNKVYGKDWKQKEAEKLKNNPPPTELDRIKNQISYYKMEISQHKLKIKELEKKAKKL